MDSEKGIFSTLALPLFALAAFGLFYIVWALLDLPPKDEVLRMAESYFETYGLLTIFVCALIEGALFAGWYFPGSLVIILGVIFAGNDPVQLTSVFAVTTIGFWCSYIFNFYLGRYGWYKLFAYLGFKEPLENAQRQLAQYGPRAIFITYWHPNLAALTATAAGILHISFRKFFVYSVIASSLYNALWTIVGYSFGEFSITLIGPKFVVAFIGAWVVLALVYRWMRRGGEKSPEKASQV